MNEPTFFAISGIYKLSELDNYERGCIGPTNETYIPHNIAGNKETLLRKFREFCNADDVTINPCDDDPSRIECQVMEDADGNIATQSQLDAFKVNQCQLWAVTYSAYVLECRSANF